MKNFIPVNRPLLYGNEIKILGESIKKGWVSGDGPYVKKFEDLFAKKLNKKYAISTTNGSSALEIAINSLGLKKNSYVMVSNFTIISCLNAILRNGLKPIFVDVNVDDYNICIDDFKKKISSKVKALILPHTYGLCSDIDTLKKFKKKFNFKVIEDCAESLGAKYKNKYVGYFGDISTFSFYSNKLITCGEGGMILTNNSKYANECKKLKNLYFGKKNRFKHDKISSNFRLSSLQAAFGIAQLKNFDKNVKLKKKIGSFYNKNLAKFKFLKLAPTKQKYSSNIYWVYPLVIKRYGKINKTHFMKFLQSQGIATRDFFYPLNIQPILKDKSKQNLKKTNAYFLFKNGLYIPSGLGNTFNEFRRVVVAIKKYDKLYYSSN